MYLSKIKQVVRIILKYNRGIIMKNMDMSEMMSKMMNNKNKQKMPPIEIMQEMCENMGNKPWKMCRKTGKSLDELIKTNKEILEEIRKKGPQNNR